MAENELTLEKLRVAERLSALETSLQSDHAARVEFRDELRKTLACINTTLRGNGGTGLLTRVGLLEQTEETRRWSLRALWGAVLMMGIKVIFDVLGIRRS